MAERTILVTGAHGFIGRHIARDLARRGNEVLGIGHGSWDKGERLRWGIRQWFESDVALDALREAGAVFDAVVHCAGSGSVSASASDPHGCFQRTVASTAAALEFARLGKHQARVVLLSSAAVYGRQGESRIDETEPTAPISTYGFHKATAEQLARGYATTFRVPVAVLRLFSVYGPGLRKQLLWDACRKLTAAKPSFSGTGSETRDWVHVEDVAALVTLAIDRAAEDCPVVNGGTGDAVSISDVVERLADALGTSSRPSFDGHPREGDPPHLIADPSRALAWGWKTRWNIDQGLQAYAEWFRRATA
jgi:UDP-glucose 4-epimerase